jgi:hypothetical protein
VRPEAGAAKKNGANCRYFQVSGCVTLMFVC